MGRRTNVIALLGVGALLTAPAGASAQSAEGGYNQPGGVVQEQIEGQPGEAATPTLQRGATAPPEQGSGLPFTGFDLLPVAGVAGGLVLIGFGIRRWTRDEPARSTSHTTPAG